MPLLMGAPRLAAGVLALTLAAGATPAWAQQAVLVVRHAERLDSSTDSPLSAAGEQRAKVLAKVAGRAGVSAIFVTQFQRTQQTAAPLAAQLTLTPVVMTVTAALVERIRRDHVNDVVLIVGHSNTVPEILTQLGAAGPVKIDDDEFDALFVLVPRGPTAPSVVRLRY